eukprot:273613-Prymnesium_polylepis.1
MVGGGHGGRAAYRDSRIGTGKRTSVRTSTFQIARRPAGSVARLEKRTYPSGRGNGCERSAPHRASPSSNAHDPHAR